MVDSVCGDLLKFNVAFAIIYIEEGIGSSFILLGNASVAWQVKRSKLSFWQVTTKWLISPQSGSEQVPVGAQILRNRSTDDVERFLSSIRFESKGKLEKLGVEIDKNP